VKRSKRERVAELREEFNGARRRGKWKDARKALLLLRRLEPDEPRWPHQLGEVERRLGDVEAAAQAFEAAVDRYVAEGFVARAVAMAKTLLLLDPSREDVLARVDPSAARARHRAARPGAISAPGRASVVHAAPPLEPDADADDDEVRFVDLDEGAVIELDLSELELIEEAPAPPAIDRLAMMPSFPLFSELPADRLRRLAEGADLVELGDGTQVIVAGEPADALYCIVSGAVRVRVPGIDRRKRLDEGDVFGESCLLDAGTRQADVFVEGDLVALRVARPVLDAVVEGLPELDDVLFELLARRVLGNFMWTSPLFAPFSPADRRELAKRFEIRRARRGVSLLVEGKRSDGLYALVQGRVDVDGVARGPGTILGVRSLLSRGAAEVTATTSAECVLLRLPAAKLNAFVAHFPPALAHLSQLAETEGAHAGDTLS